MYVSMLNLFKYFYVIFFLSPAMEEAETSDGRIEEVFSCQQESSRSVCQLLGTERETREAKTRAG